jgi:DNA-binding protein YbaB
VTESGTAADQQISALHAEADSTMARLKDRMANIQQAQQQALQATGEASSRDGSVRAKVDATGVVTALTLSPTVFERSTPEKLAQTLVATLQSAAAQARAELAAGMAPTEPEEGLSAQAAEGLAAFGIQKTGVPEVPRTAEDPTAQDTWGDQPPPVDPAAQQAWQNGHATEPEPEPSPAPQPVRAARPAARPTRDDAEDWPSDERPW